MDDIGHILVAANLDKDESLNDLSWWKDGLDEIGQVTVDISEVKEPNNIKPELMYQWRGGPDFDFEDTSAGDVKRVPRKDEANPKKVIHFARDMMNRGHRFSQVASALKERFAKVDLLAAKEGLRKLAAGDGIIGRFVLDARGYDSCKQAFASVQNSPWKSFIKYVVGCKCGDHDHFAEDAHPVLSVAKGKVASVDDYFVEAKETHKVARCASTHLRVADTGLEGWLDPSEVEQSYLRLSELGYLPKEKVDELNKSGASNVAKLCEAFRYVDNMMEQNENTKYKTDVDPSEYKMDVADGIDLDPERKSHDDPVVLGEVKEDIETPTLSDTTVEMKTEGVGDYDGSNEIEMVATSNVNIEMDAVPEGDYAGADEITLDEVRETVPEENVRVGQTVDFEF